MKQYYGMWSTQKREPKTLLHCEQCTSTPHTRNSTICHFCIGHIFLYSRFRFDMLIPRHTISNHDLYWNLFLNFSIFFQELWFIGVWCTRESKVRVYSTCFFYFLLQWQHRSSDPHWKQCPFLFTCTLLVDEYVNLPTLPMFSFIFHSCNHSISFVKPVLEKVGLDIFTKAAYITSSE
jgi:hypothetical protein